MRRILKRINGKLVDVTEDPNGVHSANPVKFQKEGRKDDPLPEPADKKTPAEKPTGLTDEARAAIFQEIDGMTIAKATASLEKVTDEELLRQLGSDARLKGTRTAADDRLQHLKEA